MPEEGGGPVLIVLPGGSGGGGEPSATVSVDLVRTGIAEGIAELTRVAEAPAAPWGYGSDLSCTSDLTETMEEVDGLSIVALSQAILRRLDCPRGALPDDADYGLSLPSYCNRGVTAADVRALAGQIGSEVTKDDRVDRAVVVVTPSPTGSSLSVKLTITPVDPRVGGFSLTLAATSAAVIIEELT